MKSQVKYNGRMRKVHQGSRGGYYVISAGKKVYLKTIKKTTAKKTTGKKTTGKKTSAKKTTATKRKTGSKKKSVKKKSKSLMRIPRMSNFKLFGGTDNKDNLKQMKLDEQLVDAADEGDAAAVVRLANEGASVDAKDEYGNPAVVAAAVGGHMYVVEALVEAGCDSNARDEYGCTALMHAAEGVGGAPEYLYLKTVKVLLKHIGSEIGGVVHRKKVELDAVDNNGMTALMWAAVEGNAEIAALLLKAGADVNRRATGGDDEGKTALEIAAAIVAERAGRGMMGQSGWTKMVAIFKKKLDKQLVDAAALGDAEAVERLAAEGASVDAKDEYGYTAVVKAAAKGHTEVVEALLRLGCDPNAPDPGVGWTALMYAAIKGHGGVVGALLEHGGVELDAVDDGGLTALMGAASRGHAAIAAQLVEAGADATLRATGSVWHGKTVVEIAEENGMKNVVAILKNTKLDAQLYEAAEEGDAAAVVRLANEGASVDAKHKEYGWPAVFIAALNGYTEVVRALLRLGCRPQRDGRERGRNRAHAGRRRRRRRSDGRAAGARRGEAGRRGQQRHDRAHARRWFQRVPGGRI